MTLSSGTMLGPYEIGVPLGAGGMGEVYMARDSRLGRDVAIKILPSALAANDDLLYRFEQEARAVAALNHPNILALYDTGRHEGVPYVVTEYLEGETLRARLSNRALSPRKAVEYGVQIARGLAAAHEKGIIHRDVKPENIFVTREGRIKVLDFGLAKFTQLAGAGAMASEAPTLPARTDPGVIIGTLGYMSPEQIRGEAVSTQSDIFLFGLVLYEMLAGKPAFRGRTAFETMQAILEDDPTPISEASPAAPPGLDRIVLHCLEKDPGDRFRSALDLAFDLEALSVDSGSGSASGAGTGSTATRRARRLARRRMLIRATAAAVAIAALAGSFFAGRALAPAPATLPASFRQLTFRQGAIGAARFAPDGQSVVYTASWEGGPKQLYLARIGSPEARDLSLPGALIASVSRAGEMAILRGGTLARADLAGGAPRDVSEDVLAADWSPDGDSLAVVRAVEGKYRVEYPIGTPLYESSALIDRLRVSPEGDRVAFAEHPLANDDRGFVRVVDRAGAPAVTSSKWASIQGIAWGPGGDEIWFAAAETGANRALYALAPSGAERLVERVAGALSLQDVSRDGRVLVDRDDLRYALAARAPGDKQERNLSWLDGTHVGDIASDGGSVVFTEGSEGGGTDYTAYIRKTDGSPAVRLGSGRVSSLSPDGKFAISMTNSDPQQLILLPTGAGEQRALPKGPVEKYINARWLADGRRIVIVGAGENGKMRTYVQDAAGGDPRPVTPEGFAGSVSTPDGRFVCARDRDGRTLLFPVDGDGSSESAGVPVRGVEGRDVPLRFAADGKHLFVVESMDLPATVERVEITSGRREKWVELMPTDVAGIRDGLRAVSITPDGKAYAYSYSRELSQLYLVEGLGGAGTR